MRIDSVSFCLFILLGAARYECGALGVAVMGHSIRILIADDHPLERAGIASIVKKSMGNVVIYEVGSFTSISETIAENQNITLVALDSRLPELDGLTGIGDLVSRYYGIFFLVIGEDLSRDAILSILGTGAQGYLPRSLEENHVSEAFLAVLSGRIYLPPTSSFLPVEPHSNGCETIREGNGIFTDRQLEVLALLIEGNSNKEIARALSISESTVKVHVNATFRSLGVHNRRSAIEKLCHIKEYSADRYSRLQQIAKSVRTTHTIPTFFVNALLGMQSIIMLTDEYILYI